MKSDYKNWIPKGMLYSLIAGTVLSFVQKLRNMGYERVELIDTTDSSFMAPKEAKRLMLYGSTLLVGKK